MSFGGREMNSCTSGNGQFAVPKSVSAPNAAAEKPSKLRTSVPAAAASHSLPSGENTDRGVESGHKSAHLASGRDEPQGERIRTGVTDEGAR